MNEDSYIIIDDYTDVELTEAQKAKLMEWYTGKIKLQPNRRDDEAH